jgi:DNA/RNA endonuclease YhcR with UshA esterase domain
MIYKNDRRKFFAPALLALVFLCNLALPAAGRATPPATPYAPAADVISIAEARSLPLGTVVTVDGAVTVPSGAFSSSTFDQGFAIQDHTGGIYVSVADNLGFAPRQQVRVTGTLADSFGLLVLTNVTDTKAHGSGPKVQPLPVATGAVGEATEGKLIRITGTITQPVFNDLPFGYIIFIDDGSGEVHSFVSASTGIDVSGLSPGQTVEVTGFSGQFADHYEVDPRTQADIKVLP